jgi:hypothetical protein
MCQVGVAQVAVDQVEQRTDFLDRGGDVAGRRGSQVVAAITLLVQSAQGRRGLVAKACEAQRTSARRRGPDGAQLGVGAVVNRGVHVVGVGREIVEPRVMDPDFGFRFRVPVGTRFGRHRTAETGGRCARHDSRIAHRISGVPRHDDLGGSIATELQMQATHRLGAAAIGLGPQTWSAAGRPEECHGAGAQARTDNGRRCAGRQQHSTADARRRAAVAFRLRLVDHSSFLPWSVPRAGER